MPFFLGKEVRTLDVTALIVAMYPVSDYRLLFLDAAKSFGEAGKKAG